MAKCFAIEKQENLGWRISDEESKFLLSQQVFIAQLRCFSTKLLDWMLNRLIILLGSADGLWLKHSLKVIGFCLSVVFLNLPERLENDLELPPNI